MVDGDRERDPGRIGPGAGRMGPAVPTGREARLWRVLVELSVQVEEARAAFAKQEKPRPLVPGRLENLVVEFDDAYTVYVEGMESLPDEGQLLALQAVDRQLAGMVAAKDAALWTELALREDRRWSQAQKLARTAIAAYAWPVRRLAVVTSETVVAEVIEALVRPPKRGERGERGERGPGGAGGRGGSGGEA